jgi:hypothetical protein
LWIRQSRQSKPTATEAEAEITFNYGHHTAFERAPTSWPVRMTSNSGSALCKDFLILPPCPPTHDSEGNFFPRLRYSAAGICFATTYVLVRTFLYDRSLKLGIYCLGGLGNAYFEEFSAVATIKVARRGNFQCLKQLSRCH